MDLTERLQLVVDATTQGAETRFDKLTASARETGDASVRSAGDVASAADRVMQAQAKQADAAGQVLVAERKLQEVRDKGNASSSQLAAAEQKLESAKRKLHLASRDVTRATGQEERATREATDATRDADKASDQYGASLVDLKGKLAGLAAGGAVGSYLKGTVEQFTEGARSSGQLAFSMNATVEEAGQLGQLFAAIGVEAGDILEIQAQFAGVIGASTEAMDELGASVVENKDGTTNWAKTLTGAIAQLQKIPDATKRNQLGFQLFGEEGYKQLSRLVSSGMSVEDAMAAIGTPFDQDDVDTAAQFDAAMMQMKLTSGEVGRTIGRELVPVVTGVVDGVGEVVDVVAGIPAPFGLAVGAAGLLGAAQRSLKSDTGLLSRALDNARTRAGSFRSALADAASGPGVLARGMGGARVAGAGLVGMMGGPLGAAVIGLGVGFTLLNKVTGDNSAFSAEAKAAQQGLTDALKESNGVVTESVRQAAAKAAQERGLLATAREAGIGAGLVTDAILGNADAYDTVNRKLAEYQGTANQDTPIYNDAQDARVALDDLAGSIGETTEGSAELAAELENSADKQALATAATEALTAAMDGGNVSTEELARLAGEAAAAQDAAAAASNRSQAAIDAYRATTDQAVTATLELMSAQYAAENAGFAFLSAMDAANEATDDATTSVDEQRQAHVALMEAALAAATATADAAVENAEASGQVVDDVTEAQLRAQAMLDDLRTRLNTPGLSKGAREELQGVVDKLQAAKDRGDIQAVLTLTGAPQVAGELDETTEDRDTTVTVESRGGPAVKAYLDGLATAPRLAIVRVESRNGPAVGDYLDGLARERLAIVRVETRGGPAVREYLDNLASNYGRGRTAVIDVQRPGAAPPALSPTGAGLFGAAARGAAGLTVEQLNVTLQADSAGRVTPASLAEAGRQAVRAIGAYERLNGQGWRRTP